MGCAKMQAHEPPVRRIDSGIVTLLFTYIAESTRLWEQHPEAIAQALARHHRMKREAIATHGGSVVKTLGDSFHAVVGTAPNAPAAVEIDRAHLAAHGGA